MIMGGGGGGMEWLAIYSGTCLKRPPLGPKLLAVLKIEVVFNYAGSTECKRII